MQTFLPYPDFKQSAEVLDDKRLFKQCVEAYQLLQALTQRRLVTTTTGVGPRGGKTKVELPREQWRIEHRQVGWQNHPATLMWTGAGFQLLEYIDVMCAEWRRRGHETTVDKKAEIVFLDAVDYMEMNATPRWWGIPGFHEAMRANLLRKDPEHYGQFGWTEEPAEGYIWP